MKKLRYTFAVLVTMLFALSGTLLQAQTPVSDWGYLGAGRTGGWHLNVGTPGNVIDSGFATLTGWSAIRGGFSTITPTTDKAFVVTGTMTYTGAGFDPWSCLRYGIFYSDSAGTIQYAGTDTATWSGTETNHLGYLFTPTTNTNDPVSWSGSGNQTVGGIVSGRWFSTYATNYGLGDIRQAPARAAALAGTYNFAMSVKLLENGNSELRFYLIKSDNKYYFGGTTIDTAITRKPGAFNSVNFAWNSNNPDLRSVALTNVNVNLTDAITVPTPPWAAYYVDQWGLLGGRSGGGWKVDTGQIIGNTGVHGDTVLSGWAAIRGAFVSPVTPTTSKALLITGQMIFTGGGFDGWSGLRYGVFRHDSVGTLSGAGKDTAHWSGLEKYATGYLFCPYSGTNDPISWAAGGNASQGGVVNSNWISTNGSDYLLGESKPQPARAVAAAGTYNFALSIAPQANGNNEVRFYLIKDDNKYYFGSTVVDTAVSRLTQTFNGVCFGVQSTDLNLRHFQVQNLKVDLGTPFTVPTPPWAAYYVDQWGLLGGRSGGGWKVDTGQIIGNTGVHGDTVLSGWAALRGAFVSPVTPTTTKALLITGQMIFTGGGFDGWGGLRYGVFRHDSVGTLSGAGKDTAHWTGLEKYATGYLFCPYSGTNDPISWAAGGNASQGGVVNSNWISTNGSDYLLGEVKPQPARAVAAAGTYNFALSIAPQANGNNEVRFYLIKDDNKYYFGSTVIDTAVTRLTQTFNGVCFGVQSTDLNLRHFQVQNLKVDLGTPFTVPTPPWAAYYVDQWGLLGGRSGGGWKVDTGQIIGNTGVHGDTVLSGWAAIRGGFISPIIPTTSKALLITGQMIFTGGGFDGWSGLRYGVFRHDSVGTLSGAGKDTAHWSGLEKYATGYLFCPYSGTNDPISWAAGGNASQGGVANANWISTNGADYLLGEVKPQPARAVAAAGTYNFALSIAPQANGNNEVRFYLIKDDNKYYFGSTVIDTAVTRLTQTFNGVCFGVQSTDLNLRHFQVQNLKLDLGTPFTVPTPPWAAYYVDQWGSYLGKTGGWKLDTGLVIGNAGIGGTVTDTSLVELRGGFPYTVTPPAGKGLVITGKMQFVGGGFEGANALRYGLFYSDSAGTLKNVGKDSAYWNGTDRGHYGYLFTPTSGTNTAPVWTGINKPATVGAINNAVWATTESASDYVLGTALQYPANAVASAGTYSFTMLYYLNSDASSTMQYNLIKSDKTYNFAGTVTDKTPVTTKFNAVGFALSNWKGSTTTKLNITDLKVDLVTVTGIQKAGDGLPKEYSLSQNYPNPFNPSTTIEFAMPKGGNIDLVLYDILGRVVTKIASGNFDAGNHKVTFNASNIPSGIYFYSLKAGNFVSVKKLMLLK